jgi:hypothetical protein
VIGEEVRVVEIFVDLGAVAHKARRLKSVEEMQQGANQKSKKKNQTRYITKHSKTNMPVCLTKKCY